MSVAHPAKFSDAILRVLKDWQLPMPLLDPFCGVGKIRQVYPSAICLDIEPEWACQGGGLVGNALRLPFGDGVFASIACSPVYGNRVSDHHEAKDGSPRHTYRHTLGRPLHPDNSGSLQWSDAYRRFHIAAWQEAHRVLRRYGMLALNVSDHIRKGEQQAVSMWHFMTLLNLGFAGIDSRCVETPRQRHGQNGDLRVAHENVYLFVKL